MRELVGVTSVACPSCRAREGRQCVDARGYLLTSGTHSARRTAWYEAEALEPA